MADKKDMTVVRNAAYKRGGLNKRERHNERKNIDYMNDDICPERAVYNVHFKRCGENGDNEVSGYEKVFDKLLADGVISVHGLRENPNIIDELVFDVNTSYFENNGGYEYAKTFYEEAYRLAVELVGGEQFVLSAVMHADERNSDISEKLKKDVYHYHLHVVYVPVVQKELRFQKTHKDPELRGKLKEVITQVSHSKKWPRVKKVDENGETVRTKNGKAVLVNSYSLLQDQFFEHMRSKGYEDIERGERGSTAEHLTVTQFKNKKEQEKAAVIAADIAEKQEAAAVLDDEAERKKKQLAGLDKEIKAVQGKVLTAKQIEQIPIKVSRPMLGGADTVSMPKDDWENVKKTALTQTRKDEEYKTALSENATFKKEKSKWRKEKQGLESRIETLETSNNQDFLARATKDAELHNLKNAVAKIPADVWAMYTKTKTQRRGIDGGDVL